MRKTLVINAGSSSLKYKMFDMPEYNVVAEGLVERIGLDMGIVTLKHDGQKTELEMPIADHEVGIKAVLDLFEEHKVIADYAEITKVGHRVVHGGEIFNGSAVVEEKELAEIKDLARLAPLHNIPNSIGIEVFSKLIPTAQNVAVFDTAFHSTMEPVSYMYPVPYTWYEEYGVRRYGMHGTSHQYITEVLGEKIGKETKDVNFINCHLGNGSSLTAVEGGKSIQTSMGFTPLGGITMGTRCGDIDPSIISFMCEQTGQTVQEITNSLNKESGLLGLSGISSDFRDIQAAVEAGNERAQMTLDVFINRIVETIGSYFVRLGGVDAITFTAGIGENAVLVRQLVCEKLACLGVELDQEANNTRGTEVISTADSKVKVLVIPTDEEFMIAKEAEQF